MNTWASMFISAMLITSHNFNLWMDKWAEAHPCNWILFSNKKHATYTNNDMVKSQMYYAKLQKPDSKGYYILYDCIYMTFWKKQTYRKKNLPVLARD